MTDDKSAVMNISEKEFGRRFRKALSVPFLLDKVCSANICEFVSAYSKVLGCSEKTFFFPLLSCAAACMGPDCYVELSSLWHEPPIIWTLVITPRSLLRMDVAEHLKQELLKMQNEMWVQNQNEDTKDHLKKFIFDMFSIQQLQDMLKLSNGHGFGIYNSIRSLHKCMIVPEDTDIMHRLHSGLGWFNDSRVTKSTVNKTRMNVSVVCTPTVVQQTLNSAPNFSELFYQCFLTVCAEENHVKFSQLSAIPETGKLQEIFLSLMKLHFSGSIVYKLNPEAMEKFGQIHDELTEKAKQMVRKNFEHKVYQPALSYLGRLSCVLHVLDNVIESIKYKVPLSRLTWNTEISATTVWFAREILGHVVEQRHSLMEQITFPQVMKKPIQTQSITVVEGQQSVSPRVQRTPQQIFQNTPSPRMSNNLTPVQNVSSSPNRPQPRVVNVRRNIMSNIAQQQPSNSQFDSLLNQNNLSPRIASVSSVGVPVTARRGFTNANTSNNPGYNIPQSLSVSVSADSTPVLLSRVPNASVLDLSEDDFFKTHRNSIKNVLVHGVCPITPSRCSHLKLIFDLTATDDAQRFSLSFARTFLKKLEKVGFGVCEGLKNGNLRQFEFRKKKFSALSNMQMKRLSDLGINEKDYSKCFKVIATKKAQNGGLVCLE